MKSCQERLGSLGYNSQTHSQFKLNQKKKIGEENLNWKMKHFFCDFFSIQRVGPFLRNVRCTCQLYKEVKTAIFVEQHSIHSIKFHF